MGERSAIAWTDDTFNPWWGCSKVSPACDHCYAEAWAKRVGKPKWGTGEPRRYFGDKHWRQPLNWNLCAAATGEPRRVFCASMADVFDNEVDQSHRERLWALIRETRYLTWQLLTKRIGNAKAMLPADFSAERYPHVWIGMTVVTQPEIDRDIGKLREIPAAVRWLSIEPQLEHVTVPAGVQWVVTGGESGGHARPYRVAWARSIVAQCRKRDAAPFIKQMGAFVVDRNDAGFDGCDEMSWPLRPDGCDPDIDHEIWGYQENYQGADCRIRLMDRAGADPNEWPEDLRVQEFPQGREG